ncbi:acetyltransferase [Methylomonas sp. SURF-2]|uniref:Acetyltransferase n=1 Tax=Methylomonas subterranea TaxID=2952225 RepID=A0ABT1TC46_9GAMM|nr:acetyltransferase [Methylomonas sp. SURF-2]MCQ8102843.1 acetyltransferase [Methylomonas sp. SURF-2]
MSRPVVLLGGGGHARVLASMLRRLEVEILGVVDPRFPVGSDCFGVSVLGDDSALCAYSPKQVGLINGIGSLPGDSGVRERLFCRYSEKGYRFDSVIDPQAFVAAEAELMQGVQVMAGVIIQTGAKIASNCIVNSGAIVEHDCRIGRHVHIAPGAVLSGGVEVGDNVHIGSGAVVIQNIRIGSGSIVGAGGIVTRDVGDGRVVYPARSHIQDRQQG